MRKRDPKQYRRCFRKFSASGCFSAFSKVIKTVTKSAKHYSDKRYDKLTYLEFDRFFKRMQYEQKDIDRFWKRNQNEAGEPLKCLRIGKKKTKVLLMPRPETVGVEKALTKSRSLAKTGTKGNKKKQVKEMNSRFGSDDSTDEESAATTEPGSEDEDEDDVSGGGAQEGEEGEEESDKVTDTPEDSDEGEDGEEEDDEEPEAPSSEAEVAPAIQARRSRGSASSAGWAALSTPRTGKKKQGIERETPSEKQIKERKYGGRGCETFDGGHQRRPEALGRELRHV